MEQTRREALLRLLGRIPQQMTFNESSWMFTPLADETYKREASLNMTFNLGHGRIGSLITRSEDVMMIKATGHVVPFTTRTGLMQGGPPDHIYSVKWSGSETRIASRPCQDLGFPSTSLSHLATATGGRGISIMSLSWEDEGYHRLLLFKHSEDGVLSVGNVMQTLSIPFITASLSNDERYLIRSNGDSLIRDDLASIEVGGLWEASSSILDTHGRKSILWVGYDDCESYYLSTARYGITRLRDERPDVDFVLPEGAVARKAIPISKECTLYAETFHGKLIFFDTRFHKHATMLIELGQLESGLGGVDVQYEISEGNDLLYGAVRDLGVLFAWDRRKMGLPVAVWSVGRPIQQFFIPPNPSSTPHLSIVG
jgi:hypothetical protein